MERNDILDGAKMKQQSALNSIILSDENEELRELSNAFLTISENEESKGDTADAFRQQMLDYKNLIDSAISVNGYDITDNAIAYNSFVEYYFDGAVILQNKKDAEDEKSRDEGSRDYHYREYQDSFDSLLGIFTAPYHYTAYLYYCACVSSDESEIEYWDEIIRIFDEIKSTTSGLFTNSSSVREAIRLGLIDLSDNFSDGNYNVDLNADWRLNLEDAFKKYFHSKDGSGNDTVDVDAVFDKIMNADELSDAEYQALLDTLSEMGIDISNIDRNDLQGSVSDAILDIYNSFNFEGGYDYETPFDLLTPEQRELFVYLYEAQNPDDAAQMNILTDQFYDPDYYFPGVEEDIINIKFLVYTADEPYKSLYIQEASKIKFGDIHLVDEDGNPTGGTNNDTISFNVDEWGRPPKGKYYSTFFHESGHAIDCLNNISVDSNRDAIIEEEVKNRITDKLNECPEFSGLSDAEKEKYRNLIVNCIMNEYDYENNNLDIAFIIKELGLDLNSDQAQKMYNYVVDELRKDIKGPAADAYGCFTGNTIGAGHSGEYWNVRKDSEDRRYVLIGEGDDADKVYLGDSYDAKKYDDELIIIKCIESGNNINRKMSPAGEFCAESFDAHITKRRKEVKDLKGFDQSTRDGLDDQVASLVD